MHNQTKPKPLDQTTLLLKPRWRGISHQIAFFVSIATGVLLIVSTSTLNEAVAAAIFAVSITILFGVSALYHRVQWSKVAREKMRRLDHSSIYLLISGTYTPVMWLTLDRTLATWILSAVWCASILGVILELAVPRAPKWLAAAIYVGIGWTAIFVVPEITAELGLLPVILIALGGLFYTVGALIYAFKRPDPAPAIFGYHEIFHLLVIAGAYLHYGVVYLFVIGRAGL